jgi:hypothetical protein
LVFPSERKSNDCWMKWNARKIERALGSNGIFPLKFIFKFFCFYKKRFILSITSKCTGKYI